MSRFYSHVNTATTILGQYKGGTPFSVFLKKFFSNERKYGSRDRRAISSLCYHYFRLGFALKEESLYERMLTSLFLSTDIPNDLLQNAKAGWNEKIGFSLVDKINIAAIVVENIFPFNNELSEDIYLKDFNTSFLIQPDVFVRVRPGKMMAVKNKLNDAQITFKEIKANCLALANATRLDDILEINKDVVIQDLNSQRIGEFVPVEALPKSPSVWDCCAASGGKSIMACDLLPHIQLTVSDVRESIIHNLIKRFKESGIKAYRSFVADLTNPKILEYTLKTSSFDLIICDAPCSGSGTWSRTPEQLLFFKQEEITHYSKLQKSIAESSIRHLKKGGYFLYITCSVFKKENEEVVEFIQKQTSLELIKKELLKGYDKKADSMFVALFKAPSY